MKWTVFIGIPFIIVFLSCHRTSSKIETTPTDIIEFGGVNYAYNSFNVVDTGYWCYYGSMCSRPYKGYRLSNSAYDCTDSFPAIHRMNQSDTTLNITFGLNSLETSPLINSSFLKKELDMKKLILKANGSEMFFFHGDINQFYGVPFVHITYNCLYQHRLTYLAGHILSTHHRIDYDSYCVDQEGKLEMIFQTLLSLRKINKPDSSTRADVKSTGYSSASHNVD